MKFRVAIIGALASACVSPAPETAALRNPVPSVGIFVVAHEDDWQLFMNPAAYRSMDEPHEKAVFIHLTAGDAGRGATGEPVPYYRSREEGALRAVRFMANARPDTGLGGAMTHAGVQRAGHNIERFTYANAVVYFLRLPDGNYQTGGGYETTGWQSLDRLRSSAIPEITAIDGSTRYAGWEDLVNTLSAIVDAERSPGDSLNLNIAETDPNLNPRDHPDHRNTALAMEEVASRLPCASVRRYDEYDTRTRPMNLSGEDLIVDAGTWAATASGLSDTYSKSTWDPVHNSWVGRSYSRSTPPKGRCD